jgi:hypothetical protein
MNVLGSGFIPILLYSAYAEGSQQDDSILTEASDNILTEASDDILVE